MQVNVTEVEDILFEPSTETTSTTEADEAAFYFSCRYNTYWHFLTDKTC